MDINIVSEVVNKDSSKSMSSSALTGSWNVNLWLGSTSGNKSSSSAGFHASETSQNVKVDVSFRASLVTVDRSGWFQPQFFDMSDAFMRASEHVRWSEWPKDVTNSAEAIKRIKSSSEGGAFDAGQSLLPAFPVGYILAKDVLVKISQSSSSNSIDTKTLSKQANAAGGVLCFSFSHASNSSSDSSHVHMEHRSDGLVLKIPGPQILGYIMQLAPRDQSRKYEPTKNTFYLPSDHSLTVPGSSSSGRAHAMPVTSGPGGVPSPKTDTESTRPRGNANVPEVHNNDHGSRPGAGIIDEILDLAKDPESLGLVRELARALKG